MLIEPISREELRESDGIYIEHIEEGFEYYYSSVYAGSDYRIKQFLQKCIEINGEEHSYVDFYYGVLSKKQKAALHEQLDREDEAVIEMHNTKGTDVYFPLKQETLPLFAKLSSNEWLFSSFYFTKFPCLIWGNYGCKYPGFFKDEEIMDIYDPLAKECHLKVEYLSRRGYLDKRKQKR